MIEYGLVIVHIQVKSTESDSNLNFHVSVTMFMLGLKEKKRLINKEEMLKRTCQR